MANKPFLQFLAESSSVVTFGNDTWFYEYSIGGDGEGEKEDEKETADTCTIRGRLRLGGLAQKLLLSCNHLSQDRTMPFVSA